MVKGRIPLVWNPGDTMATGVEEYLAEMGMTKAMLEALDPTLSNTRQVSLKTFGMVEDQKQTTLLNLPVKTA